MNPARPLQSASTPAVPSRAYPPTAPKIIPVMVAITTFWHCRVPEKAMHRITGTSPLVKEHLELAKKHFPDPDAIKNYLVCRSINAEEVSSGA